VKYKSKYIPVVMINSNAII